MSQLTGEQLAAISREIVRIKAEHYGKGPTEAKSYQFDIFLVSVLKGGLTRLEETLLEAGEEDLVRQVRLSFQHQVGPEFTGAVERISGRKVLAYESQIVTDPTYIFELFVLEDSHD